MEIRRKLRKNMPAPEIVLWQKLRSGQLSGLKFRRQYSIGKYIVDFYCPEKRLAIELDGDSHYDQKAVECDKERQGLIESQNIRVVRFTNKEVMENIEGVVGRISEFVSTSLTPS